MLNLHLLSDASQFTALLLVVTLVAESLRAWSDWWKRRRSGLHWLDWNDSPRSNWTLFPEKTVLALVILMLAIMLSSRIDATHHDRQPLTRVQLVVMAGIECGTLLTLLGILVTSGRTVRDYGFRWKELASQVRDGFEGFLLAIVPTALLIFLTSPLRTNTNRNALLILLSETSDPVTIGLIAVLAVILAPVYEELLFRVVLQGWFTTIMPPRLGILLTAGLFAAIHGLPDALALVPLACILGTVFHRRHSYLSVLVIHGLFNATMLTLSLLTEE